MNWYRNPLLVGLLSFGLFVSSPTFAASASLDLGAYADNLGQRLSAPAGYTTQVSTLTGLLRIRPKFSVSSSLAFEPSFGLLVPWRSGADGFAKVVTSFTALDFSVTFLSRCAFRFGTALQWNWSLTQAGSLELNNGSGTSTFYLPGGTSSSFQLLVEAALEFRLTPTLSLGVEAWASQVMSPTKRRFSAAAYLGVQL